MRPSEINLALQFLGFDPSTDYTQTGDLFNPSNVILTWSPHITNPPTDAEIEQAYATFMSDAHQMPDLKIHNKQLVDLYAGSARARYVTTTSGQEMVYISKADQASAYVAAGYPVDTTNYPFIAADAMTFGVTPQQAADAIIAKRNEWMVKGAEIESIRLSAKLHIDTLTTMASLDAYMQQVKTEFEAL